MVINNLYVALFFLNDRLRGLESFNGTEESLREEIILLKGVVMELMEEARDETEQH